MLLAMFTRLTVITLLALLALPAAASAAPQFVNSDDEPSRDLADSVYPYVAVGGGFDIPVTIADNALCTDNNEDGDDIAGNDYSLVGSKFNVLLRPNEQTPFSVAKTVVVNRDMIDVSCEGNEGVVYVEPELSITAPQNRQQVKVEFVYSGGSQETDIAPMYTAFNQRFRWCPGPGCYKPLKKGKVSVQVSGPKQMIGMKVYYLWRNAKSDTFKPYKTVTLKSRKGKAFAQVDHKQSKGNWGAYACLNYSVKYPLMWTGNACPTKPIKSAELEKLFPGATRGY